MPANQMTPILMQGLRLYYRILTLHRKQLKGQLRKLGDIYVKQEFRYHHNNPTPNYYKQFYAQWLQYEQELSKKGVKEASRAMKPEEEKLLTNDQKEALNTLRDELSKKKKM